MRLRLAGTSSCFALSGAYLGEYLWGDRAPPAPPRPRFGRSGYIPNFLRLSRKVRLIISLGMVLMPFRHHSVQVIPFPALPKLQGISLKERLALAAIPASGPPPPRPPHLEDTHLLETHHSCGPRAFLHGNGEYSTLYTHFSLNTLPFPYLRSSFFWPASARF